MANIRADGEENKAANGYWYRKVNGKWKLKHHIVAEQILGRPINGSDRVTFKDNDPDNLDPSNLNITIKKGGRLARIEYLKAKIVVLQDELRELESK